MAVPGREPHPDRSAVVNRNEVLDWTEVTDEPFEQGQERKLPDHQSWHNNTYRWWRRLRVMPHARLWTETDWQFAEDTAILKDILYRAEVKQGIAGIATECRRREDQMGTTIEARRKLRIRYVKPTAPRPTAVAGGKVTPLERRQRLLSDD